MLRDVFYYGQKPNAHPREKPAKNLEDARQQSTTEHFWIINEYCDYTNFDWDFEFDFLPDDQVWHDTCNNAWPSIQQKDSGTWLCPKHHTDTIIYRDDVEPIKRTENYNNWVLLEKIDKTKFDFGWHPDPTDPPYIYKWGCKYYKPEIKHVLEYRVEGATQEKWMEELVELEPDYDNIIEAQLIDKTKFDMSWRPDPLDPPYIYVWGNKHIDGTLQSTFEYHVPGATEIKYMSEHVPVLPEWDRWKIIERVDKTSFDFTWRPDPREPPYIYVWGNKYYNGEYGSTIEYHTPGATERKYMSNDVGVLPIMEHYKILHKVEKFDFSWRPNPKEPAYIYVFGNTQYPAEIDPTIEYHTPGATERKYIDAIVAKLADEPDKFQVLHPVTKFDYSWRPNPKDPPYIYVFGNQWHDAVKMPTVMYTVEGATEYKYITDTIATLAPDRTQWIIPKNIVDSKFDYSWIPDPDAPPYIYEFGTQWQKTGGPRYYVEGATEIKYIDLFKIQRLPDKTNFEIVSDVVIKNFDYSWHPDATEEPYIYIFGNQYYTGEIMPTIQYKVPGATQIKYINSIVATVRSHGDNWLIPNNIIYDKFDFNWIPNPKDPPYIYEWNTQWQKNGGIKYIVPGATETKYIESNSIKTVPIRDKFEVIGNLKVKKFDYSWHPDSTAQPYIYVFGNNQYPAEIMPTIKYVVEGATEVKYVHDVVAVLDTDMTNWTIPNNIDVDSFDFSWVPDPNSPAYVYEFATVWNDRGGPIYTVEGATERKYIEDIKAKTKPYKNKFVELLPVDNFDYSWTPHPESPPYIYVFGNQWYAGEVEPTIEYRVEGATEKKYIHDIVAKVKQNKSKFNILHPILEDEFDFSWHPDPGSPAYIYVFGNNQYPAEIMPTVEYHVEGATEVKYVSEVVAKLDKNMANWKELIPIDKDKFDFSWVPNPKDPPYIYVWGNKYEPAEIKPTIEYRVPGAIEKKYMQEPVEVLPEWNRWVKKLPVDINKSKDHGFDFSWRPDPREPAFIYVFGNQWNIAEVEPTIEYHCPGATEKKYIQDSVVHVMPQPENFEVLFDIENFDFSWRPNPGSPPYIYVFGNQWNSAEKEPTIKYKVGDATDFKYMNNIVAEIRSNMKLWQIPEGFDVDNFDFSWRPDPYDPAYIYEFATEYADRGGPRYVVEGATDIKYMSHIKAKLRAKVVPKYYIKTTLDDLVSEHADEIFWALRKSINYDNFDFNWRPTKDQEQYVHAFGSPDSEQTQTYFINATFYLQGYTDKNFVEQDKKVSEEYLAELFVQPDIFLVDRGNKEVQERFEYLKTRFPNVTKTRFFNNWVDTINRCINRSTTELCWILNSELDYSNFDFKYYPNPWQLKMVHVFGTQWSHWGTTFMVNRETFTEDTKYVKIIEHLSNLNFVKSKKAKATNNLYDIYLIDHGNSHTNDVQQLLESKAGDKSVTIVNYDNNYLTTIRNIINNCRPAKEHYIWICSSVCDYNKFDFSYICDPFAKNNLHVFPSDQQKFGDTFLIDVNRMRELLPDMTLLEDYVKINYNQHQRASRYPAPIFITQEDTHVHVTKQKFDYPYAVFKTSDNEQLEINYKHPISLWNYDSKNIEILSTGGTAIVVPKESELYVKDELYDYPYISKTDRLQHSKPLDIIFLSNGESCADENYQYLLDSTKQNKNRIVRVDGINGRVAAYHAAAEASQTPWFFTVFAKLKVNNRFDWNWQPDRLQISKHYIFTAKNPVNGLTYGHQAMIAYNKKLTLANMGRGLDFTLDDPHDSIDLLSGIALFNTDSYSTWRTAFREAIKLKSDYSDISYERLNTWLNVAQGEYAQDCLRGANDAVEYYHNVNGDPDKLKLSYEWAWLSEYYKRKYN